MLTTSREALRLQDEALLRVPALSLPSAGKALSPAQLQSFEAVRLLLDRARTVQPSFDINSHNASAVADVCNRLDGIPLAIELAAARLRVLTIEQISDAWRIDSDSSPAAATGLRQVDIKRCTR